MFSLLSLCRKDEISRKIVVAVFGNNVEETLDFVERIVSTSSIRQWCSDIVAVVDGTEHIQ